MPLALKLAELDPPLTVSPEDLFTTLTRSAINLQSLLNELQCSKEEVQRTLNDPSTGELLRLKTQLVTSSSNSSP